MTELSPSAVRVRMFVRHCEQRVAEVPVKSLRREYA